MAEVNIRFWIECVKQGESTTGFADISTQKSTNRGFISGLSPIEYQLRSEFSRNGRCYRFRRS